MVLSSFICTNLLRPERFPELAGRSGELDNNKVPVAVDFSACPLAPVFAVDWIHPVNRDELVHVITAFHATYLM